MWIAPGFTGALFLLLSLATILADELIPPAFSFNDYLVARVRVHLLAARDDDALCTTLADSDIARIMRKVNGVWAQAGIHFHVESIVREEPGPAGPELANARADHSWLLSRIPAATHDDISFQLYYIKEFGPNGVFFPKAIFVKDTASLRVVAGGIDEPIPRVTSHELGHALGLPHRQNVTNLMASGTTGTALNESEIERARQTAASSKRFLRAADLLIEADTLHASGRTDEARARYEQLSTLAIEVEAMRRVRQRTTPQPE
jgi:hypothetical protein